MLEESLKGKVLLTHLAGVWSKEIHEHSQEKMQTLYRKIPECNRQWELKNVGKNVVSEEKNE